MKTNAATTARPVYSDREQTAEQRQQLAYGRNRQGAPPGPVTEAVYARYVAGELTLGQVAELVSSYIQRA
ncbi:hypothetical protein D0N36_18355 [Hymenobacter lapidiphilus]|uniref:hypothetical protein n=1 Tax=Hymenobacter sp. CCM 8763 TaxID=2303334 RepID=UPI000E35508B|nr:hypothetical protein [Hymenobacter sp. CCM 8763]RFP63649.1 hypothetical protein D0N36_18355 [Hymenobacter sp. CCM 8763]